MDEVTIATLLRQLQEIREAEAVVLGKRPLKILFSLRLYSNECEVKIETDTVGYANCTESGDSPQAVGAAVVQSVRSTFERQDKGFEKKEAEIAWQIAKSSKELSEVQAIRARIRTMAGIKEGQPTTPSDRYTRDLP